MAARAVIFIAFPYAMQADGMGNVVGDARPGKGWVIPKKGVYTGEAMDALVAVLLA